MGGTSRKNVDDRKEERFKKGKKKDSVISFFLMDDRENCAHQFED
ncbi:hypothetical protein L798_01253 [Zootermopsis nevadensis]|uniref:Uncharacterized protein n=1 Tax=Zootermopsis nevadensis TaxID=136037 RepID=A0A067QJC0_ZOONE|nr:hypothetical protein L798_01253 [Zootermopsis nevadensis]